jgi:hypothetical protein
MSCVLDNGAPRYRLHTCPPVEQAALFGEGG